VTLVIGVEILKTLTKKELAGLVAEMAGSKKTTALETVNVLFTVMREELIQGNRIEIRGFGVLEVRETKAKPNARNPRTGEVVYVPPRRKTHFKPGKELKKALHQPLEQES